MNTDPVSAEVRRIMRERSGGICEVCAVAYATNLHHRKNRSQGGGHDPTNLLHLCGSGTTGCHGFITGHPKLSYEYGYSVRSRLDPAAVPVRLARRGWTVLDPAGGYTSVAPTTDLPDPPAESPSGGPGQPPP
jgi:hypothetical protein